MKKLLPVLIVLLVARTAAAAPADFTGDWLVYLQDGQRTLVGLLQLQQGNDGWTAYLEGGPARVTIEGDDITLYADSRDVRGFVFDRKLEGTLEGRGMRGHYTQEGAAAQKEKGGPWHAERPVAESGAADDVTLDDFAGTWTATQELDFRKYSMALTEAGQRWLDEYLPYYDQPDVRCTSIGLPALATYTFPFEVIASERRLTFIYEYQSRVRRIWTNGRQPSEFMPPSRMGHSNARLVDGVLVVETVMLDKTVRDFRGELISENARIEERYRLSDDGNTLTAVIRVHDPENYERAPIRRRQWVRDDKAEIFPYTCDPDSFYLTMFEDGELDMYLKRADRRF